MKKLILLFLLISNPVWSAELKIPPCKTDCGFDNVSASGLTVDSIATNTLEVYSTAIFNTSVTQPLRIQEIGGPDQLYIWHDGAKSNIASQVGKLALQGADNTISMGITANQTLTWFGTTTLDNNDFKVHKDYEFLFSSTAAASGAKDIGFNRYSAGVLAITDGSTGLGDLLVDAIVTTGAIRYAFDTVTSASFPVDNHNRLRIIASNKAIDLPLIDCAATLSGRTYLMIAFDVTSSITLTPASGDSIHDGATDAAYTGLDTTREANEFTCDGADNWIRFP